MSNKNLCKAKKEKNDEFYTFYKDIAKEMKYYKKELEGKVIYLPCDNPKWSNFYKYFKRNYKKLKLKGLIATYYDITNLITIKTTFYGDVKQEEVLNNNGDFFLNKEILNECDVVITNPPFSLFRDFMKILNDYNKEYIIIGNINFISCKIVFELIFYDKLFLGGTRVNRFYTPTKEIKPVSCYWYTNIKVKKKIPFLKLTKKYTPEDYPKYDNYNVINVDKVADIPYDYDDVMGVPISFLEKYNSEQFEILGEATRGCHDFFPDTKKYDTYWQVKQNGIKTKASGKKINENGVLVMNDKRHDYYINKDGRIVQSVYSRIFIRKK